MNQNKFKFLYTTILILGVCAFTPPEKCAAPCRERCPQARTVPYMTTDPGGSVPKSAAGEKAMAPGIPKEKLSAPGRTQKPVATEKETAPDYSPFLAPLYV
ncbi:MAG TPA: hypothetical protein VK563_09095 [Puia sp.]|nr:hypothetical protein [Puia sp.]